MKATVKILSGEKVLSESEIHGFFASNCVDKAKDRLLTMTDKLSDEQLKSVTIMRIDVDYTTRTK